MWLSSEANQERARAAEKQFEKSNFVKELKRWSEENREKCDPCSTAPLNNSALKQKRHQGKVLPEASRDRHRRLCRSTGDWNLDEHATDPPVFATQDMPEVLEELRKAQD